MSNIAVSSNTPLAAASSDPAQVPAPAPVAAIADEPLPKVERQRRGQSARDLYLYVLITALVAGCWGVTRMGLWTSKSDTAYWLGVAGGVGMLLLLTYPMRKHLGFMRRSGPAGHWFFGHMVLGVAGPLLILLHSGFEIGSLNAGVAFYSMVVVAASGVIGRFLYLRVHRSLNGERESLKQLRERLALDDEAAARLRFAPVVVERLHTFERFAVQRRMGSGIEVLLALFVIPWMRWSTTVSCRAELRRRLVTVAHTEGWSRRRLKSTLKQAHALTRAYLMGAQRVAMFAAWDRLFSWWHVAHVPFVYILAMSAVVHVIAVHAY
jgi:hypothetical protein